MISDQRFFSGFPASSTALWVLLAALFLAAPAWAQQQQQRQQAQAHVHGRSTLDLVVDGRSIAITMASPLDNFVGFENVPRTAAEKTAAEEALDKLRDAGDLFAIDAAGNCKPGPVDLRSAALGVGKPDVHDAHGQDHSEGHADLNATFVFTCTNAAAARFIDTAFFTSFRNLQQIDVQIAAPQGRFERTLKRPNMRLAWGK